MKNMIVQINKFLGWLLIIASLMSTVFYVIYEPMLYISKTVSPELYRIFSENKPKDGMQLFMFLSYANMILFGITLLLKKKTVLLFYIGYIFSLFYDYFGNASYYAQLDSVYKPVIPRIVFLIGITIISLLYLMLCFKLQIYKNIKEKEKVGI